MGSAPDMEDVVIIGAGQAGIGVSYFLKRAGISHVVLERNEIGHSWRSQRWDSFSFNTPNGLTVMPGCRYVGSEPDGFMSHLAFVEILENLARNHDLPVIARTPVVALSAAADVARYKITTPDRTIFSRNVVIASGSQNCPKSPALAQSIPAGIAQVHASAYRAPSLLAPGAVLVVGSGSSGGQIAEDLIAAGRTVFISTSRVPSFPRRYRGRDIIAWFAENGRLAQEAEHLDPAALSVPQPLLSGVEGGHTLSLPWLAHLGATLLGRLIAVDNGRLQFDGSLGGNVAFGNDTSAEARWSIDAYISRHGLDAPDAEPDPADAVSLSLDNCDPRDIDLDRAGISTILWCTGYRTEFDWIRLPIFEAANRPKHLRGVTECKGVYITGMQWLSARRSGLVLGVENDSRFIASQIAASL
jgi:putative flavoprotein involved in K+ transport